MIVGVIGTGIMGRNHVRVYSKMKEVEEIFVYDIDEKASSKVAEEYGISSCKSLEELLGKVDAVSICVPTKYHFETAKKVIEAGKHCLIEKPIALEIDEGKKIVELVKGKEIVCGVGHIERFNPIIPEIKKIVKKPRYVEIKRHNPDSGRITDADIISDLMIHDIDTVWNYFFRGIDFEMRGAAGVRNKLLDLVSSLAVFDSTVVSLSASRLSSNKVRSIIIEEEDKTVVGNYITQEVHVYKGVEKKDHTNTSYAQETLVEKLAVQKVEPLKLELSSFLESIKNKKPFEVSLEDAVNALEVADKIRSMVNK